MFFGELGLLKPYKSSILDFGTEKTDLQPIVDVIFYHDRKIIVTKHSTSNNQFGIEKENGFKRFINITDFHGNFKVKDKLISEVDCKTFLL